MPTMPLHHDVLTHQLAGRQVSHISAADNGRLEIHFVDGVILSIEPGGAGLAASISSPDSRPETPAARPQPTQRQRDYLRFITKYILRFGRPPAESDIQRHFLVSAPSVNQMIQTLERRGFITRQPGVAPFNLCVFRCLGRTHARSERPSHFKSARETAEA
jgi:hypothetical protein